jgi:hypothetical protein
MLWYASVINGYAIEASDGRLGTVSDFLFEDTSWMIRWLVVDTGHWLSGRKVHLPPSVLEQPDGLGGGWILGHATVTGHHNAELHTAQYRASFDPAFSLRFARGLGRLKAAQLPHSAVPELARRRARPTRFSQGSSARPARLRKPRGCPSLEGNGAAT